MPFDCSAVSRVPEFRLEFRDVTNNEWHTTCNTCRQRHRSDVARYDVMEFRSEFWCSRNCSSTMRAFPGSALRVIGYFYHTADWHPRSCDISFVHFRIFFIKTPIWVWLPVKVSETSFPRKGIPWGHLVWFWKCLHVFFCKLLCLFDGSMHVGYMIKCNMVRFLTRYLVAASEVQVNTLDQKCIKRNYCQS
jgi:hypothetical protein